MSAEPTKDLSPPVKRGDLTDDTPSTGGFVLVPGTKLRIRNMTGVPTHPATGKHRVVNLCRSGHEEVIEVHTDAELHAAMVSGYRVVMPEGRACTALVVVSRHIGPDGRGIGLILIPDPKTPPDSDREAAR
jgi:hypothetical protein